jgi:hypothetical protein
MTIAIIGTAGRDKTKPMTLELWKWMLRDVYSRVPKGAHVVSGGAAWADHLAVSMFLFGHAGEISLFLPAPFVFSTGEYVKGADHFEEDGWKSAGGIANYYHRRFSDVIKRDTLHQIGDVVRQYWTVENSPVRIEQEPSSPGAGGMFVRNKKVAQADEMLAYTFGIGDEPDDGGTRDTWNKCQGKKTHITLPLSQYL